MKTIDTPLFALLSIIAAIAAVAPTTRAQGIEAVATHDAYVSTSTSTKLTGAEAVAKVQSGGTAFFRFDFSLVPASATGNQLATARLLLFVGKVSNAGNIEVRRCTTAWQESTLNGLTAPALDPTPVASAAISFPSKNETLEIDITNLVRLWLDGTVPNFGVAILGAGFFSVGVEFETKEATKTSRAPVLALEFKTLVAGPQGSPGLPGPQGVQGIPGVVGPIGPAGPAGAAGPQGVPGVSGGVGPNGPQGAQGPTGPKGPVGDVGLSGAVGAQGPAGIDGPPGPAGAQGIDGPAGLQGDATPGLQGPTGNAGPQGPTGATGPQGPDGAQGPQGATGLQGLTGSAGPEGAVGLQGPAGPAGATGQAGLQGSIGPAGPQGPPGPQGPAGSAAPFTIVGTSAVYTNGKVGIGTATPTQLLEVGGNLALKNGWLGNDTQLVTDFRTNNLTALQLVSHGATEPPSLIAGHSSNGIPSTGFPIVGVTIAGGGSGSTGGHNLAEGTFSSIGGGAGNKVFQRSTVRGGLQNRASNFETTVGGGDTNLVEKNQTTVMGGASNLAEFDFGAIVGGFGNKNFNFDFTGGGQQNEMIGAASVVLGGALHKVATQFGTVLGGQNAEIGQGLSSTAERVFAAGRFSRSEFNGTFTWGDSEQTTLSTGAANQTLIRASGGVRIISGVNPVTVGVELAPGSGSWSSLSDRGSKYAIVDANDEAVLAKIAKLPLYTWSYKGNEHVRHMGPMAQDLFETFGLGDDKKRISMTDADGIALASLRALAKQNVRLGSKIEVAESRLCESETALDRADSLLKEAQRRFDALEH